MTEQLINPLVGEAIRFYGTIVGTPGVSTEILEMCNKNIKKLLDTIEPKLRSLTAQEAGIIT